MDQIARRVDGLLVSIEDSSKILRKHLAGPNALVEIEKTLRQLQTVLASVFTLKATYLESVKQTLSLSWSGRFESAYNAVCECYEWAKSYGAEIIREQAQRVSEWLKTLDRYLDEIAESA